MSTTELESERDLIERLENNPDECYHLNIEPDPDAEVPVDKQEAQQWFAIAARGDIAMYSDGMFSTGSRDSYESRHISSAFRHDSGSLKPLSEAPEEFAEKLGRAGGESQ